MANTENKGTIYQNLNKIFNFDGFGFQDQKSGLIIPKEPKIIIKGNSPEEIMKKGLELEQKREIQNKFFKTTDRGFQKALQFEAARLPMYIDFEGMEYYPLISSALDLFMEEATTIGFNGKMLNIYSDKERIKYLLEEFFYDIVNVNVNLPFWTRNVVKYGDNFTFLYGERKKGITHVKQMVNYEIERFERIQNEKPLIKFKERMTGDEFNVFEIAHFRLLGDDKFLPYGSSILSKVRRTWRQLCVDSTTDIWTPNGIIKIKDLKIGDEIYSYDFESKKTIATKVKNVLKTGEKEVFEIKTNHREIRLTNDHPILTIDINGEYSYKNINEITNEKIISSISNDLIFDEENIISTENIGIREVWDIEVGNELHNFIANGIVVHNCMAEDAMLTYRIVRAGEKKVFKIDVGNIDEDDLEEYIYKVATKFKKTTQVNPNDGQMDYRFNILGNDEDYFLPVRNANTQTGIETLPGACLALDTKIELLDGRSLELNKIIEEYEQGKELWAYSINPETGEIVPGMITWAGITRKNTEVLKITLDNGETITCTPDHKFPTKFNGTKEAKDLSIGESMWALNKDKKIIVGGKKNKHTYEIIYDHSINDWKYTHRMVANYMKNIDQHETFKYVINSDNLKTIHHKDFNRYNNNPNNLCFMNSIDHFKYHNNIANFRYSLYSEETKELHIELRKKGVQTYWDNISNDELILKQNIAINNSLKSREKSVKTFNDNPNKKSIIEKRVNSTKKLRESYDFYVKAIEPQTIKYSEKLLDLLVDYFNEHYRLDLILEREINIENSEWLNEFWRLNPNNAQLKKMTKITNNNIDKMLKHFGYLNWCDFKKKVPCYNHKIVSIEYLSEKQDTGTITIDGDEKFHNFHNFALTCGVFTKNSNLNDIMDIEYLRDNLITGLGIPKPFLSFQDAAGGGKSMAQYDIRFAKKVNRIQQAMIQELNKMAIIHLYLLGYSGEDLNSFTLTLTNPSTQQELLKSELMRDKAQTYAELTRSESGIAPMSHTSAKRLIFNMSDKEIVNDLKQQKMERVINQELVDSPIVIRKSGLFKDIDDKYGVPEGMMMSGGTNQGMTPEGGMEMPTMGGGMGTPPPIGGNTEGGVPPTAGTLPPSGGGAEMGGAPPVENILRNKPMLTEEEYDSHVEKLVYGSSIQPEVKKSIKNKKILKENDNINNELNTNAQNMINEIDELLKKTEDFNTTTKLNESEDIDLEEIGDIIVE